MAKDYRKRGRWRKTWRERWKACGLWKGIREAMVFGEDSPLWGCCMHGRGPCKGEEKKATRLFVGAGRRERLARCGLLSGPVNGSLACKKRGLESAKIKDPKRGNGSGAQ